MDTNSAMMLGISRETHIGRYRLAASDERVLGSGAYATVFRARDQVRGRDVAIKVLADNHSLNLDVRERFLTEARLLDRVGRSSNRVVTVFDIDELDSGQPFIVMDLAEAGSLEQRLKQLDRPPAAIEMCWLIEELATCMEALHSHDIAHRDIKPSNVLIANPNRDDGAEQPNQLIDRRNERLVFVDLGLARDLNRSATAMSVGVGTLGYVAPELVADPATADHRVDIYAASVMVAEIFAWDPRSDDACPLIPAPARNVLRRSVSADPDQRPATAAAWGRDLVAAWTPPPSTTPPATAEPQPHAAPPPNIAPAPGDAIGQSTRSRPWLLVALVAFVLVALAGGAWAVLTQRDAGLAPQEVFVGRTSVLRIDAEPAGPVTWTVGDDSTTDDTTLAIRPTAPGRIVVTATWTDLNGDEQSQRIVLQAADE